MRDGEIPQGLAGVLIHVPIASRNYFFTLKMKEKYILIPDRVKINKKIPPGAKLLFGDILSLSRGTGYCFASNTYFSELYGVHINSITNWMKALKENMLIKITYEKRDGKSVRKVYTKNCVGVHKKLYSTHTKNCGHNNINKIKNKTKVVI